MKKRKPRVSRISRPLKIDYSAHLETADELYYIHRALMRLLCKWGRVGMKTKGIYPDLLKASDLIMKIRNQASDLYDRQYPTLPDFYFGRGRGG